MPADQGQTSLTLAHLLQPSSWNLPEWNSPQIEDPIGVADGSAPPVRIKDKLDELATSLALLQRYSNTLRPIHQLSPDILLLIFQDISDDYNDPLHPTFGCYPWIYVTHVCHHWRSIALACPLLWTHVNTQYPKAALCCLERSVDATLSLVISPAALDRDVRDVVLANFSRVCHIYLPSNMLRTDDNTVHQALIPIIESPALHLETLFVYKVQTPNDCFPLPTIFKNCTPRLTTLKLCYAIPELGSVSFTNLKHLFIRGKKSAPITMEIARLLEVLEACPGLEILKTTKMKIIPSQEELKPVRLEHLQLLDVARCSARVASDIVRHLETPSCTMRLNVSLERSADFAFHFGIPADLAPEHHLRDIRRLHVKYRSAYSSIVLDGTAGGHLFDVHAFISSSDSSNIGEMPTVAGALLRSISNTLDLTYCEEFTISETQYMHPHAGFSRRTWSDVLRRMPQLKTIHVRLMTVGDGGFIRAVLSALSTPDEITDKMLCPLLDTLIVEEDRTWSALQCYTLAQERTRRGSPLKRISLRLPHYENLEDLEDTDIAILRTVVDVVDLDPPEVAPPQFPVASW